MVNTGCDGIWATLHGTERYGMLNLSNTVQSVLIPILTYHSIDDSGSMISVSPEIFKRQMAQLRAKGYRTISLSDALQSIRNGLPFQEKTFVITFDDGYRNILTKALPIMDLNGFKGTVFLVTDLCGKSVKWPGLSRCSILSWTEARQLLSAGFELGAHTASHPDLTRISITDAHHEILCSKMEIQDHTGEDVKVFAYPFGRSNPRLKSIIRNLFNGACSTRLGRARYNCDPYDIKRIDMYYLRNDRLFCLLSNDILDQYLKLRQFLRDVKTALRSITK